MDSTTFISQMNRQIEQRKDNLSAVGNFRKGNVDKSWRFYHVTQQTLRNRNLLLGDVGWYYHKEICNRWPSYNVLLICQVVMPNHIHEIYYTEDVFNIVKLRQISARTTSTFMKKVQRQKNYDKIAEKLFERSPGYAPIKDSCQFLIALKYIKDNDLYLRETGSKAPYSCFDDWDKNNFKEFAVDGLESIFEMSIEKLNGILNLDRSKVNDIAKSLNPHTEYFTK